MKSLVRVVIVFAAVALATDYATGETRSEAAGSEAQAHSDAKSALLSCSDDLAHPVQHESVGEDIKHKEHAAVLKLVRQCEATDVAVHSGPWSDSRTWRDGQLPGTGAKVLVPKGVTVEVDAILDKAELDWIKVDGRLSFRPHQNTAVAVRTLVVTKEGFLQIGSAGEPVRADVRARILFVPHGQRDRQNDPYDLGGGLISLGVVQMIAVSKTAHAVTGTRLTRGTKLLEFEAPPEGWRIGDQLLVPGTDPYNNEDEVRTIIGMGKEDRTFHLDRQLRFNHIAPSGISIPIGNLTRSIELRSLAARPTKARAHVMIMHAQTGTIIDGAAFLHLGRTDTRFAHTFPELGPDGLTKAGTDANTIGRYAVHFHVVSGARTDVPPNSVRNSVVIDSPKYGIVNHGGHLLAENNVTFQIAGAHFVAENGSEIGAFRRNMAVRSAGSGEVALESRMSIYDFGHGGHGFWLQSGGVEVTDNWASGHAGAGIFSMGMQFRERGEEVFFDARNVSGSPYADDRGRIRSSEVNFYFARNLVTSSGIGLEIWYHKVYAAYYDHNEPGVVDGLTVWNVAEHAVSIPYSKHVALRKLRLNGSRKSRGFAVACSGIIGNGLTESITIDGAEIREFPVGIKLPERGQNLVRNTTLRNSVNLEIGVALHKDRQIHLDNVTFESGDDTGADIAMNGVVPHGDIALLFEDSRIDLTDRDGRNQRLFFPFQHPDAIPFPNEGPTAFEVSRAQRSML